MKIFKRRGQISLEFMLLMGLIFALLVSSVNMLENGPDSAQAQTIRVSTLSSAKIIADTISTGLNLVVPQAPYAKKTYIVTTGFLSKPQLVSEAWGYASPSLVIKITNTSVVVGITGGGLTLSLSGPTKNAVSVPIVSSPETDLQASIPLKDIPPQLTIVVQKSPATTPQITYSSGILTITVG